MLVKKVERLNTRILDLKQLNHCMIEYYEKQKKNE